MPKQPIASASIVECWCVQWQLDLSLVSSGAFDSFNDCFDDWQTPDDIPDRLLFGEIEDIVDN